MATSSIRYLLFQFLLLAGIGLILIVGCEEKARPPADETAKKAAGTGEGDRSMAKPHAVQEILLSPDDPEARKQWIKNVNQKRPPVLKHFQVTRAGAGAWEACMSEDAIRKTPRIRICPNTEITETTRCYTTYLTRVDQPLPMELWVEKGRLVRVMIRNAFYKTPEDVGIRDPLAKVRATYKSIEYLRGDDREWIATVPELATHFYLDDKTAKSPEAIDPFVEITQMETVFRCVFQH